MSVKKKIIIVKKIDDRYWKSCDEIEQAYDEVIDQLRRQVSVELIHTSSELFNQSVDKIKSSIDTEMDNFIYFLSHNLNFNPYLHKLSKYKADVTLLIPVYGDMTIQINRWAQAHHTLRGWKTYLLVSSSASKGQIEKFIQNRALLNIVHPPVSDRYFNQNIISEKNTFLYAGRISYGKNILQMMNTFIKASQVNPSISLSICGDFDSIGFRFTKYRFSREYIKKEFFKLIDASKGKIRYLGFIPMDQMPALYAKHQYFVSMSTYQDEDYGLAVAQSICSSCYPIVSAWGGYRDFIPATLVDVKYTKNHSFGFDEKSLMKAFCSPPNFSNDRLLDFASKHLSTKSTAHTILNILKKEKIRYEGQSQFFFRYRIAYKKNKGRPYLYVAEDSDIASLFKEVYSSYCASC